jgi:hypothetical protein
LIQRFCFIRKTVKLQNMQSKLRENHTNGVKNHTRNHTRWGCGGRAELQNPFMGILMRKNAGVITAGWGGSRRQEYQKLSGWFGGLIVPFKDDGKIR